MTAAEYGRPAGNLKVEGVADDKVSRGSGYDGRAITESIDQQESGDVVSYKMLQVQNTRDGEPDLILMVEYKNMAVFDRGVKYFEEMAKEIMGSLDDMQTANVERGELRTLRDSVLTREIHFKE